MRCRRKSARGPASRRRWARRRIVRGVRFVCAVEGEGTRDRSRDASRTAARRWRRRRAAVVRGGGRGAGGGAAVQRRAVWRCRRWRRGSGRRWSGGRARRRGRGGDPGRPTGMAALTRWTNGRFPRAFDFINEQRRRQITITQMAELLKDFDMYVPGNGYDVGLHASTGHPCVVVPYKFDSPAAGGGGGGRAGGAAAGGAAAGAAAASPTPSPRQARRHSRHRSSTTSSRSVPSSRAICTTTTRFCRSRISTRSARAGTRIGR